MAEYQVQFTHSKDDGTTNPIYPINRAMDVKVGILTDGELELPGSVNGETLQTSIKNIRNYCKEVLKRAPINHADTNKVYGGATGERYGHVKLSDVYEGDRETDVDAMASESVGASSYAVRTAYKYLLNLVNTKLGASHADVTATASSYGHVKLSDAYTASAGGAASGVGASSLALYNAYTALNSYMQSHVTSTATANKFSHVALSDTYTSNAGAAENGIGASSLALYNAYTALNNGKANVSHTHNYAGSASAGGIATSANLVYATSHPGTWYMDSQWDGTYFQTNFKNGSSYLPMRVSYAANADKATTAENANFSAQSAFSTSASEATHATNADVATTSTYCNTATNYQSGGNIEQMFTAICQTSAITKNWNWAGKDGSPTWLWGGENGTDMYVYKPKNLQVSRCTSGICKPGSGLSVGVSADGTFFRSYNEAGNMISNYITLGSGNSRWRQLYVEASSISTSDRNLKKNICNLTDTHLKFFLKLQPCSFLFKDNSSNRTHVGFISQDVEDAMAECGLTALDFAGFCKDQKKKVYIDKESEEEIEEPILDENGNPTYVYSLRYEEFIALNTFAIQKLYDEISDIKKVLKENHLM